MRTRDKQWIFKRFYAGESVAAICRTMNADGCKCAEIENIIREGHAKGWDSGKREVK